MSEYPLAAADVVKAYDEQQQNVRNNREFEAIAKEIELQRLEIQIADKKIKEAQYQIDVKNAEISGTKSKLDERRKDLDNKKGELETIVSENEEEERGIMAQREEATCSRSRFPLRQSRAPRAPWRDGAGNRT